MNNKIFIVWKREEGWINGGGKESLRNAGRFKEGRTRSGEIKAGGMIGRMEGEEMRQISEGT